MAYHSRAHNLPLLFRHHLFGVLLKPAHVRWSLGANGWVAKTPKSYDLCQEVVENSISAEILDNDIKIELVKPTISVNQQLYLTTTTFGCNTMGQQIGTTSQKQTLTVSCHQNSVTVIDYANELNICEENTSITIRNKFGEKITLTSLEVAAKEMPQSIRSIGIQSIGNSKFDKDNHLYHDLRLAIKYTSEKGGRWGRPEEWMDDLSIQLPLQSKREILENKINFFCGNDPASYRILEYQKGSTFEECTGVGISNPLTATANYNGQWHIGKKYITRINIELDVIDDEFHRDKNEIEKRFPKHEWKDEDSIGVMKGSFQREEPIQFALPYDRIWTTPPDNRVLPEAKLKITIHRIKHNGIPYGELSNLDGLEDFHFKKDGNLLIPSERGGYGWHYPNH
uniref:Uncharacterized protein n=1 Tax=uncultured marine group II/III euryarchaeote KM3_74_A11 TaxID=1456500 RepID=A0A075HKE4_9EURY|nr:hypothetical protein [uncultured marine group II/III euryarchaeote KM3_74_A11]